MSVDIIDGSEPAPYEEEEEIQLMDTDGTNLQLDEPLTDTNINSVKKINKEKEDEEKDEEELKKMPSLLVIEKLKVYIRDGANSHHVETITVDDKFYELPTTDELASIELTEENLKDLLESLNLTKKDFRTSSSPGGTSRPESLYIRGVNNMSTQEILNYFEEFKPIGIEWVSDQSCNIFWYDTLVPFQVLATMTAPGPTIAHRRPVNYDHAMRLNKRKSSSISKDDDDNNESSVDVSLPPGHWREGDFQSVDKPESSIKLYLRYTTVDDRKIRGAENQSEYYRQYGNPNYDNMTGLISRSKKRALNAMKSNRFRDFTVVKSNDPTSASNSIIEESTTITTATVPDDNTTDSKVKFTVVLPPKKGSPNVEEEEEEKVEGDDEDGHRSKRQRRRRSWEDEDIDEQRRKEKTHFTVTLDSTSKHRKDSKNKSNETSGSTKDDEDDDADLSSITDARQILERKRRNRK